jgi:hypothetical protein
MSTREVELAAGNDMALVCDLTYLKEQDTACRREQQGDSD